MLVVPRPSSASAWSPTSRTPWRAVTAWTVIVVCCSLYVNLSFAVRDPADLRFFPPFQPGFNGNCNQLLGGEYINIGRAVAAGRGYADPFGQPTGPTAWMPPALPTLLAGLLWAFDGNRCAVMTVMILFQDLSLIGTGLLVLVLADRTAGRLGVVVGFGGCLVALLVHFFRCFLTTSDLGVTLAALDLLIVGLCWGRPLRGWVMAVGWGAFGGLCALINPIVGLTWLVLSLAAGRRPGGRSRVAVAVLAAGVTVSPWVVRNYLVFNRLIPVKSNLAYELYQSQCLQTEGALRATTINANHPNDHPDGPEGRPYKDLGEMAFLDRKGEAFADTVRARPGDFARRVGARFLAATLVYEPFAPLEEESPAWLWVNRLAHPLPFAALLVLLHTARRAPLQRTQWAAIGVYTVYLLPYIGMSYYDRYAAPLFGVKVLLVVWAADRLLCRRARPTTRTGEGPSVQVILSRLPRNC